MHIPDAFIPIWQGAIYWIIALVFVALALRWAKNEMSEEKIPIVAGTCSRNLRPAVL